MNKVLKNKRAIFIFTAPAAIMFLAIMLIPIVCAIALAFCDWNSIGAPKFIGAGNFVEMFAKDKTMRIAIRNSLFIVIFSLVTQQTMGLLIAAVLSARGTKFRNLFKNIYYMPCVISSAALALLFSFLFNPNMGINALLKEFGIQGP